MSGFLKARLSKVPGPTLDTFTYDDMRGTLRLRKAIVSLYRDHIVAPGVELEAEAGTPEPRSGKVDSVLTRYLSPAPTGTPPERRAGLARCLATLKARQSLAKELKAASPTGPLSPGGFSCASTPSPLQRPPCRPGVA